MKKLAVLFSALLVPLLAAGLMAGAAGGATTAGTTAAVAACTYAEPVPERVAAAMEQLTLAPVDEQHWEQYAHDPSLELSTTDFSRSTISDRHQVLVAAVWSIVSKELHPTILTPVMVWWLGRVPDERDAWRDAAVPGWAGTLETYVAEFAVVYATSADVAAAGETCDTTYIPCTPTASSCTGAAAVIAWADSQIGAPYAAINPYRFGTPPWPGGTLKGFRGDVYTFPTGTVVYDCSGFVITAWRHGGVDFESVYGSQDFTTSRIPDAPRWSLQPGDIAVYSPLNTVGHVVLVHDITDGVVHTIEATPAGVHIGKLNWSRVIALKRPQPPAPPPGADGEGHYSLPVDRALVNEARLSAQHSGYPAIDIMLHEGTPLLAPASGRVIYVTNNPRNERDCGPNGCDPCGIGVVIATNGWHFTLCHMSRLDVQVGEHVDAGQRVGLSGNSGHSSGPHVHLEIRNPDHVPVCPQELLLAVLDGRAVPSLDSLATSACAV